MIYNSQEEEATQMSINGWIEKVHLAYNEWKSVFCMQWTFIQSYEKKETRLHTQYEWTENILLSEVS